MGFLKELGKVRLADVLLFLQDFGFHYAVTLPFFFFFSPPLFSVPADTFWLRSLGSSAALSFQLGEKCFPCCTGTTPTAFSTERVLGTPWPWCVLQVSRFKGSENWMALLGHPREKPLEAKGNLKTNK